MIKKVDIDKISINDDNPRYIEEDKLEELKTSIKDFPEMLKLRPIVVDETDTILGGNMRYKACQQLDMKEVWIVQAKDLTEEQRKEFILKDNQGYGEWDYEKLKGWDKDMLKTSGFDDWDIVGIFGEYDKDSEFKGNLEGSNFDPNATDVNDYIKQNIIFFNEMMIEFEDMEVKKDIRTIMEGVDKEHFTNELKQLIKKYGKETIR